jgi:DNA-binding transcriptional LysR family regulator
LELDQFHQQRWVLREPGSGTRAIFDSAVQRSGAQVHLFFALNRQEAIKQSVKAGLGIGCLSCLSVAEEVEAGELVVLQTPLELTRRFSLVIDSEGRSDALVRAFLTFLETL